MTEEFKWVSFYTEFATRLLQYKSERTSLIEMLKSAYSDIGMNLPKLETDNIPNDIDPFTIFGSFNKGITDTNRISILEGLKSAFDISAYNQAKSQYAVRWNLTMGLYWIRPYTFINLDSRNREFMSNPDNISANVVEEMKNLKSVPNAEKYLSICDKCRAAFESGEYEYTLFPELSHKAWIVSIETSEMEKEALSDDEVNATRWKDNVNKFENEVAFARSYLVKAGYIDNNVHGIWTLTENGQAVDMTDELTSEIFKSGMSDNAAHSNRDSKGSAMADENVETTHYWLYSPGEGAGIWDECCKKGIMAIGWDEIGDLHQYSSKKEMKEAMKENIDPERTYTMVALMRHGSLRMK